MATGSPARQPAGGIAATTGHDPACELRSTPPHGASPPLAQEPVASRPWRRRNRGLERGARTQRQFQEVTNEQIGRVLERLVKLD
jgi:hypothetical protein